MEFEGRFLFFMGLYGYGKYRFTDGRACQTLAIRMRKEEAKRFVRICGTYRRHRDESILGDEACLKRKIKTVLYRNLLNTFAMQ